MIVGPPIPWALVPSGAVVLGKDGIPRAVSRVQHHGADGDTVWLEGWPIAVHYQATARTNLVTIEPTDAIATLGAAGLNPEEITDHG